MNDIDNSLNDELISEKEIAYLLGQKDELQTIKRLMGWQIDNEDIKMQYKDTINLQKKIYSDDHYIQCRVRLITPTF